MRIIAGRAKGRRLLSPKGSLTRPMQDRIKEALFSSLADAVIDADVLDLYAGTGSMGFEALSRGARSAVFVESNRRAAETLAMNREIVALGGNIVVADVGAFLASSVAMFDLVFVDPPYPHTDDSVAEIMSSVNPRMVPGGLAVLHRSVGAACPETESLMLVDDRRYGGAQLWRFEKEQP